MKISTVRVRNKRTGKTMVVNAENYLAMQHSSGDWELVSEQFVNKTEVPATVIIEPTEKTDVEETMDVTFGVSGTDEETSEESGDEEIEIEIEIEDTSEESGETETDASEEVKPRRRGRRTKSED